MESVIMQLQTQTDKLPKADVSIDENFYVCRSVDNVVYTTSFGLANSFGVQHNNMLRAIRNIVNSYVPPEMRNNFVDTEYFTQQGKRMPCIKINYSGFIFFCLNYTTGDPLIKIKYIEIMTRLENCIKNAYNTDVGILSSKVSALQTATLAPTMQSLDALDIDDPIERRRFIDKAMMLAKQDLEEMDKIIAQQAQIIQKAQPAIEFTAAVNNCEDTILVYELAGNISQRLFELGYTAATINQDQLYKYLRNKGYVSKRQGTTWNKPRVNAIRDGFLKTRESVYTDANGNQRISRVTGVTGKGQIHLMEEILQIYKNGGSI